MKAIFGIAPVLALVVVVMVSSQVHQSCNTDSDCANVTCSNPDHTVECHSNECHCHLETECTVDSDCYARCGSDATCDSNGHCHGDCTHQ